MYIDSNIITDPIENRKNFGQQETKVPKKAEMLLSKALFWFGLGFGKLDTSQDLVHIHNKSARKSKLKKKTSSIPSLTSTNQSIHRGIYLMSTTKGHILHISKANGAKLSKKSDQHQHS